MSNHFHHNLFNLKLPTLATPRVDSGTVAVFGWWQVNSYDKSIPKTRSQKCLGSVGTIYLGMPLQLN